MKKKYKFKTVKLTVEQDKELDRQFKSCEKKRELINHYGCKSFYDLKFLIGKEQINKLLKRKDFRSIKILNLPKPPTARVYKPTLIKEHYLNNYQFNKDKQCYQKIKN